MNFRYLSFELKLFTRNNVLMKYFLFIWMSVFALIIFQKVATSDKVVNLVYSFVYLYLFLFVCSCYIMRTYSKISNNLELINCIPFDFAKYLILVYRINTFNLAIVYLIAFFTISNEANIRLQLSAIFLLFTGIFSYLLIILSAFLNSNMDRNITSLSNMKFKNSNTVLLGFLFGFFMVGFVILYSFFINSFIFNIALIIVGLLGTTMHKIIVRGITSFLNTQKMYLLERYRVY